MFATPIFARHIKNKIKLNNLICVAPDVGGVERTRALSRRLNVNIAIIGLGQIGIYLLNELSNKKKDIRFIYFNERSSKSKINYRK